MEGEQTVILWGTGLCNYSVLVPSVSPLLPLPLPGLKLSASAFFFSTPVNLCLFFPPSPSIAIEWHLQRPTEVNYRTGIKKILGSLAA